MTTQVKIVLSAELLLRRTYKRLQRSWRYTACLDPAS